MSQAQEITFKASVVIPVKGAHDSLIRTLNSLAVQAPDLIEEIIVIENGSHEISSLPKLPFKNQLIHLRVASRSAARNHGVLKASAPWILFLDADVELSENWLEQVSKSITRETSAIQTAIIPKLHRDNLLQKIRKYRGLMNGGYRFLSLIKKNPQKIVLNSACFLIRKDLFQKLNGFDEALDRHEDLDFTQRLISLEVTVQGLSKIKCYVHYDGHIFSYFCREIECGYHIVRFHEKWSEGGVLSSINALSLKVVDWIKRWREVAQDSNARHLHFLELLFYWVVS